MTSGMHHHNIKLSETKDRISKAGLGVKKNTKINSLQVDKTENHWDVSKKLMKFGEE